MARARYDIELSIIADWQCVLRMIVLPVRTRHRDLASTQKASLCDYFSTVIVVHHHSNQ